MEMISVVAGICYREGEILLGRRHESEGRFAGYWEFPGGKVEDGESLEQALQREFEEELGCAVSRLQFFEKMNWDYPDRKVQLQFFLVRLDCEDPQLLKLNAHSELAWHSVDVALNLNLLPANFQIVEKIIRDRESVENFSSNQNR